MPRRSAVRDWVDALEPRTFFNATDVPGPRSTVEPALSRMAGTPDGAIQRVRNGQYWKCPPPTRWGRGGPDAMNAALHAAGPGAGPAGVAAANALGLTTQVPTTPTVAVVGRAPKGLGRVRLVTRSNHFRRSLSPIEIAVLEVLRDHPRTTEVDWSTVRDRIRDLVQQGIVDADRLGSAVRGERKPDVLDRLAEILS